jgi:hypothetical protein
MTTQPEALRHAQELDRRGLLEEAAELRRLHALNGELLGACRTAMMLKHLGGMLPGSREIVDLVVDAARAALAKAEGEPK